MADAIRRKSPATYADLLTVPDHLVAEIVDGDLFSTPRPALRHAHSSSMLGVEIGGPYHQGRGGPGGWWILDEPEVHLGDDVLVPDLGGWQRIRLPEMPDAAYLTLAPDWVCEVLSPATERLDRSRKLKVYAREGVRHAWLLNPTLRTLEVLRLENGHWVVVATHDGDQSVAVEPFAEVAIDLGRLWA
jgi:Uma2 family endonuclease